MTSRLIQNAIFLFTLQLCLFQVAHGEGTTPTQAPSASPSPLPTISPVPVTAPPPTTPQPPPLLREEDLDSEQPRPVPSARPPRVDNALSFSYAPSYGAQITAQNRLNLKSLPVYEFSYLTNSKVAGIRLSRVQIPSTQIYNAKTFTTSYAGDRIFTTVEAFLGWDLSIFTFGKLFQIYLPLRAGYVLADVSKTDDDTIAMSVDTAIGFGFRAFRKLFFQPEVSVLYHLGIPLTSFTNLGNDYVTIQNSTSEALKLGLSGWEAKVGLSLHFDGGDE